MATTPPPNPQVIPAPASGPRTTMAEVMRRSYRQSDQFHRDARAFRNRLVLATLITAAVAVALVLLQWRLPTGSIFQVPNDHGGLSRWAILMLVMVFGSLRALVTAIPSMAAIPTVNSPYNFPLPQGLLKIVFGALTATVGVIVIGSSGVTTGFASMPALIGVAVVFGAGQQAVTQFLDKRAGQLVSQAGAGK